MGRAGRAPPLSDTKSAWLLDVCAGRTELVPGEWALVKGAPRYLCVAWPEFRTEQNLN